MVGNLEALEAEPLQHFMSAQGAEWTASAWAVLWGCNQWIIIYTDSEYIFAVCHAVGMLSKEWGLLTSAGKSISNGTEIQMLLEAIKLPRDISVVRCPAHIKGSSKTEINNPAQIYAQVTQGDHAQWESWEASWNRKLEFGLLRESPFY